MKIKIYIYTVKDHLNNISWAVCKETCADIMLSAETKDGVFWFENRAYRLEDWTLDNGFEFKLIEKEIEI